MVEPSPPLKVQHEVPEICPRYGGAERTKRDVTVIVGEERFYVHKDLLMARIPFFNDLFNSNMIESISGEVDLSKINVDTVVMLLDYAYIGKLTISEANVQDLMSGAHFLRMESVLTECNQFAILHVRIETALPLYLMCKAFGNDGRTMLMLGTFIRKFFHFISLTPEFLQLTVDEVMNFLRQDAIHVNKEIEIFLVILRWIDGKAERMDHALRLFVCMRLNPAIIAEVKQIRPAFLTAVEQQLFISEPLAKRARTETMYSGSRRLCAMDHEIIFAFGPQRYSRLHLPLTDISTLFRSSIYLYNTFKHEWKESATISSEVSNSAVVVVKNMICIIGGVENDVCRRCCTCFEVVNGRSPDYTEKIKLSERKIALMENARRDFAAGVIGEIIIVAGGLSKDNCALNIAEMLDTSDSSSEWKIIAPMKKRRESPASCVLNGHLYVLGGKNGRKIFNDGERYDPATNTWSRIPPMKYQKHSFGAAVFNEQIYVAGGCGRNETRNAVERYDPTTNTWESLSALRLIEGPTHLVVSCGKLFAIGATSKLDVFGAWQMERYWPETNTWIVRMRHDEFKPGTSYGVLPVSADFDLRV